MKSFFGVALFLVSGFAVGAPDRWVEVHDVVSSQLRGGTIPVSGCMLRSTTQSYQWCGGGVLECAKSPHNYDNQGSEKALNSAKCGQYEDCYSYPISLTTCS